MGKNKDKKDKNKKKDKKDKKEVQEMIRLIEDVSEKVRDNVLNQRIHKKISSLRAIGGGYNDNNDNNDYASRLQRGRGGLQTKCTACRRRLFGDD